MALLSGELPGHDKITAQNQVFAWEKCVEIQQMAFSLTVVHRKKYGPILPALETDVWLT